MAHLQSPRGHPLVLYSLIVATLGVMTGQFVRSQVPSEVENLTPTCSQRLNLMWSKYTSPTTWTDQCNPDCLMQCSQILQEAIYSTTSKDCPPQAEITACFNVYPAEWEDYVQDCELFKIEANAEAEAEGGEAEAEGAAEAEGGPMAAPSSLADLPGGEAEAGAEGEASAEGSAETTSLTNTPLPTSEPLANGASEASEGEAEATSTTASPPSPKPAEAEAEGGRRRLLSGEGEGEAEGGEASGAGLGCFPKFKTMEEFNVYMNGTYWDTYYSAPSDTAGILMSVAFWVSLAGVGFLVRS